MMPRRGSDSRGRNLPATLPEATFEVAGANYRVPRVSTHPYLVSVTGQDGPGVAEKLFAALATAGIDVNDVEQVRVHGRLLLCVEIATVGTGGPDGLTDTIAAAVGDERITVSIAPLVESDDREDRGDRFLVTLLASD